jgi:hypothetical protein
VQSDVQFSGAQRLAAARCTANSSRARGVAAQIDRGAHGLHATRTQQRNHFTCLTIFVGDY